ncbi:uncharacterized protein B0I36DRAFT_346268 [Microdochium trichocladiopsis]|uniref:Uncharacterized protein n=1 Tax=Microdochium trichocladiopsis TaxID=1682393 RepID=A0A9P8YF27_9PEZI|nr:uncharacterized protein B0I36DRAFT_346268 [Microdochium trichocladiopsis]KAH7038270.1 hypothetical protein B0I36DRAFT_346268 [Microdochium trichocladiopsis]
MAGARRQGRLTRSHHTTLLAISFLLLFACTVQATCYYPNGDIAYNDAPCKTNGEHSLCCGVGYACMKSGVCQLSQDTPSQLGSTGFVRGSCTDKSWNEPACPMFCLDPEINNVGGYNELGKCYDRPEDMYYCIDSVHNKLVCGNTTAGALYFVGMSSSCSPVLLLAALSWERS